MQDELAKLRLGEDYYYEGPYVVFTAQYHLKRGTCCNSGCRHCPYRNSAGEENSSQSPKKPISHGGSLAATRGRWRRSSGWSLRSGRSNRGSTNQQRLPGEAEAAA